MPKRILLAWVSLEVNPATRTHVQAAGELSQKTGWKTGRVRQERKVANKRHVNKSIKLGLEPAGQHWESV